MTKTVNNLSASLANDPRYSELKNYIYEELVKSDHESIVKVFQTIQDLAKDAGENKFYEGNRTSSDKESSREALPEIDPDLDISLTPDEIAARK